MKQRYINCCCSKCLTADDRCISDLAKYQLYTSVCTVGLPTYLKHSIVNASERLGLSLTDVKAFKNRKAIRKSETAGKKPTVSKNEPSGIRTMMPLYATSKYIVDVDVDAGAEK